MCLQKTGCIQNFLLKYGFHFRLGKTSYIHILPNVEYLGPLVDDVELVLSNEVTAFFKLLKNPPCDLIIVSNEVGMGIIPENPLARKFRDFSGWLNQEAAKYADKVILMVAGIPLHTKDKHD